MQITICFITSSNDEMFEWFDDNLMKSNPDKFHLLFSTNDNIAIRIGIFQIFFLLKDSYFH